MNPKSDVAAKEAFKLHLQGRGFEDVRIIRAPADIAAKRDGVTHYFELKLTSKTGSYFGAATITEWEAALNDPSRFRFVVARQINGVWNFREYSPEEFIQFSDIPPFKIFFRIPAGGTIPNAKCGKPRRAVVATLENLRSLIQFRADLKRTHEQSTGLNTATLDS